MQQAGERGRDRGLSGDLIFADDDGVVSVPAVAVEEVIRLACEKVARDNPRRAELMEGAFLRDVYRKYGVL